jgi:hypothetical protein
MESGFVTDDDVKVSYLPDEPGEGDRRHVRLAEGLADSGLL